LWQEKEKHGNKRQFSPNEQRVGGIFFGTKPNNVLVENVGQRFSLVYRDFSLSSRLVSATGV
jgi:hypothetical protein